MKPCLISILLLAATSVSAQQDQRFTQWDSDRSGFLTREELPERIRGNFDRVDRNGDGKISPEEHAAVSQRSRPDGGGPGGLPDTVETRKDIDYVGGGNPRQTLDLYLPKERADGARPLPLVVFIHGGAWRAGSKDGAWGRLHTLLGDGEYAGAAINYRLTDEATWPAQIHDCKAAIRWLRANAEELGIDPERIAVWGTSAGGHLVAMLGVAGDVPELEGELGPLADVSSEVAAVVNFFGPANLLTMGDHPSTMDHNAADSPESKLIGGKLQDHPDKANNASPQHWISEGDEPSLIVHGTKDQLVPYPQSVEFEKALEAAGVPTVLLTVEEGGHGQGFGPAVDTAVKTFLDQQLRGVEGSLEDAKIAAGE